MPTQVFVGVAIAVLVVNAAFAYRSVVRLIEHDHWVSHTYEVIGDLEQVISVLKDAETGKRGYVLAGTDNYLELYNTAVAKLHAQIAEAKQLTSDNPVQQRRFPELEQKIDRRMGLLQQGIDLRRKEIGGGAQIALQDTGELQMDEIRVLIKSMQDEEYRLLVTRQSDSARSARSSEVSLVLSNVLAIAFLLLIGRILHREQRLRESSAEIAERFRSLSKYAPVGIKQVALDGRLLTANPALCRMLGYSESELVGRTFEELTHPDDRERERQQIEAMLRGQREFVHCDLRYLHRDGSLLWVTLATSLVRGGAGEPLYRISIVQDITDRKRAEEALRLSEERLRFSLEACHIGAWDIDLDDHTAYRSLEHSRIFGYEEFLPRWTLDDFLRHVLPEHRSLIEAMVREGTATKQGWAHECPIRRADGEVRWIWFSGRHLVTDSGRSRVAGIVQDITERKMADEALRQSLERLEKVLEIETVGVMFWDLNTGCLVDANDAFLKLMGYARSDVEARDLTWQKFTPPEYYDVSRAEIEKFMVTGRVGPYEKEYFCKDGTKRWLLFAGSSLGGNQCVEFCVDIADRKKAEQQLMELNQQLEDRVRRRTAQLEASNRELEAFSYSVSHDLRAPLRTMDGFSHALLEDCAGSLDEKGQHYVARISAAAQKMGQLIDDLLQLSRIGRAEMRLKRVDLSQIAQGVIEDLRTSDPDRQVEVAIEPRLEANGDPGLLQVVLQNLLSNAWKFTSRREGAKIELGRLNGGSHGVFFVRDNGAGFDMKYADHLFSPFKRLHADEEFKGTGIGLATVQRIIRRHQGRIWAEAFTEQGATFYFELGSHSGYSPGVVPDGQREAVDRDR